MVRFLSVCKCSACELPACSAAECARSAAECARSAAERAHSATECARSAADFPECKTFVVLYALVGLYDLSALPDGLPSVIVVVVVVVVSV